MSQSFYKIQEALVELGKLCQQLSELGVTDMITGEPQEFKEALVYGEQTCARTLGELVYKRKGQCILIFFPYPHLSKYKIFIEQYSGRKLLLFSFRIVFLSY